MNSSRIKKAPCTIAFILTLLFSTVAGAMLVNVTTANPMAFLPYITIKSDGSVEPQTEFINQEGNVYTLTSDLVRNYAVKIQRSNIVFDGAAHVINGSFVTGYGYSNKGLSVESVTNVTVKDVEVRGFMIADAAIESTTKSFFLRLKAGFLYLENSDFNTIAESNIGHELMRYSNNNTIMRNTIDLVELGAGLNNTFFENNFATKFGWSVKEGNFWDNGSIGNYWPHYKGVDANGDGIGDTPYVIMGETWDEQLNKDTQIAKGQDNYPLMNPWDPTKPIDTFPPRISISSPESKVYNESSVPLAFLVNEPSSSMSYSLDGQGNVTISGNATLGWLPNGSHNLTVYVTDRAGNTGVSESIYFIVAATETFPAVPVAAASIASVTVAGVVVLVYFRKRKRQTVAA